MEPLEFRLELFNIESGHTSDITSKIKCDFPAAPYQFMYIDPSRLLITDYFNKQIWIIDADFLNGKLVFETPYSPYFSSCRNNKIAIPYFREHKVYQHDLNTGDVSIIDSEYIVMPASTYIGTDGLLYVMTSVGLQVYDSDGKLQYQLCTLQQNSHEFSIGEGAFNITAGKSFKNGNLLITDQANLCVHLLNITDQE